MSEAFEKWCADTPGLGCCAPEDRVACVHDLKAAWNAGMERAEKLCLHHRSERNAGTYDKAFTVCAAAIRREREAG